MLSFMSGFACLLHGTHPFIYGPRTILFDVPCQNHPRYRSAADGGDYGPKYDYTAAAATTQNGASASAPGPDTTTLTATTAHSIQELTQTADQRLVS